MHMAQLMPLPLTASCFSKIQIGFTFLVPAHLGSPGKRAVKRVCVCVSNYRPVLLTCVACKIMERIIASEMLSYLHAHDVISKQQHGFLARRCTESNLLECLNDWTLALHNHKSVIALYVDFA